MSEAPAVRTSINSACRFLARVSPVPDRIEARIMLGACAWQESRWVHRRQIRGPARSFWQFEANGVQGVLEHRASGPVALGALKALGVSDVALGVGGEPRPDVVLALIEDDDLLGAVLARLLLYTVPQPLAPAQGEAGMWAAWDQYLMAWNPGRPRVETWPQAWRAAGGGF